MSSTTEKIWSQKVQKQMLLECLQSVKSMSNIKHLASWLCLIALHRLARMLFTSSLWQLHSSFVLKVDLRSTPRISPDWVSFSVVRDQQVSERVWLYHIRSRRWWRRQGLGRTWGSLNRCRRWWRGQRCLSRDCVVRPSATRCSCGRTRRNSRTRFPPVHIWCEHSQYLQYSSV